MIWLTAGLLLTPLRAEAAPAPGAIARIADAEGQPLGAVTLTEVQNGVLLDLDLSGLPAGWHAFHIHQTGACSPDFTAAGGHEHGAADTHGFFSEDGPGAGDMSNHWLADDGILKAQVFNPRVTVVGAGDRTELLDTDGSAIILHSGADDYESQPSGAAGARIACGVIESL
ncbi:MAG: superoxide dismutase family protein [Spirulinaceae cyanobacterium SM2_1_0]|nr:superoxide dismutase family protein [Spirulinaceae cyanobacterium SM2_1_0]